MNVLYAMATEHLTAEQRLDFDAALDPDLARERRLSQLLGDPDIDVELV